MHAGAKYLIGLVFVRHRVVSGGAALLSMWASSPYSTAFKSSAPSTGDNFSDCTGKAEVFTNLTDPSNFDHIASVAYLMSFAKLFQDLYRTLRSEGCAAIVGTVLLRLHTSDLGAAL